MSPVLRLSHLHGSPVQRLGSSLSQTQRDYSYFCDETDDENITAYLEARTRYQLAGCRARLRTLRVIVTSLNSNTTDESISCSNSFSVVVGFSMNISTPLMTSTTSRSRCFEKSIRGYFSNQIPLNNTRTVNNSIAVNRNQPIRHFNVVKGNVQSPDINRPIPLFTEQCRFTIPSGVLTNKKTKVKTAIK